MPRRKAPSCDIENIFETFPSHETVVKTAKPFHLTSHFYCQGESKGK